MDVKFQRLLFLSAVLFVGLVSFSSYYFILDYFFTGSDTLTLIDTSRVHQLHDVIGIFTEPLMADSKFVEVGKFFRPVATLSYTLDFTIWDLNPFGFQLTNLLLNTVVSCLLAIVMYQLSNGNLLFAWLSGLMFALHPILVESVPAIDRRHDILAAVFLLSAFSLFLKNKRQEFKSSLLSGLSIFLYALSLGSKETAVILPVVLVGYLLLASNSPNRLDRLLQSMKATGLYWLTTLAFVAWRTYVLKGLGGYTKQDDLQLNDFVAYVVNIIYNYVIDLVYPADPLGVLSGSLANWWIVVALVFLGVYLFAFFRTNLFGEDADYKRESKNILLFLGFWSMLPLALFLGTLTFAHRSMYNSAIPFSALLAYPLSETLKVFFSNKVSGFKEVFSRRFWPVFSRWLVAILGISMFCYLLICSPLISEYDQWGASARIGRIVLINLAAGASDLPSDCKVNLYNLPDGLKSYEKREVKAKEVTYLTEYSIESWLRLCGLKRKPDVVIHSRSRPWDLSDGFSVAMMQLGRKNLFAIIKTNRSETRSKILSLFP